VAKRTIFPAWLPAVMSHVNTHVLASHKMRRLPCIRLIFVFCKHRFWVQDMVSANGMGLRNWNASALHESLWGSMLFVASVAPRRWQCGRVALGRLETLHSGAGIKRR